MKKKSIRYFLGIALCTLALASCGKKGEATQTSEISKISVSTIDISEDEDITVEGDFVITSEDGTYEQNGKVYTITKAGTYQLSGSLENGRIVVDAQDAEVTLELSGVKLTSSENSPILILSADTVKIKTIEGTQNVIQDQRQTKTIDDDAQGEGAISAKCDLKFVGKGELYVTGQYNNGIHTTKDLSIKNVTLKSVAFNNSLKGKDSITMESGNVVAISTSGDGLKTEDSDISSKGNQRGTVTISGGHLDIYAAEDGIDASYNVVVENDAVVNIFTDKYSSYSDYVASTSGTLYFRSSVANSKYRVAVYFYNDDIDNGIWVDATYDSYVTTSNRKSYHQYKIKKPTGYTNMCVYEFLNTQEENSRETYAYASENQTINTSKDVYTMGTISGTSFTGSWSTYSTQSNPMGGGFFPGGMNEGNSNKSDHSAKGIKADNEILIQGGTIAIQANDDGLHANSGTALENGNTGTGNVTINGGSLSVVSADDGIHADATVTINDGSIYIQEAYEGIEGNVIYFNGGTSKVYASDDGVNASSGSNTTAIYVTGGSLDVTVGSGDTDGIDSNGIYTQTGGFVISRNPNTDTSGNMAALDTDGVVTITGGTFISVGSVGETPSSSSQNWVLFGSSSTGGGFRPGRASSSSGITFSKGDYSIAGTSISFTLDQSYTNLWISSDQLSSNQSYTLSGPTSKTWTQSSGKTQISS